MRRTIKMKINRTISIVLCMSMVTMFTVHKPIGAEEITTEEITTEETSENTGNLTGNFAEDVDYLVEKGTPYDMNEVYEVYGNAPKEINSANDWIANEAESEKISQFQEILEELAKQNHTDETTGVFVSGDTPWYIKVEVEEIDAGPLQESYEAYRERQTTKMKKLTMKMKKLTMKMKKLTRKM